jgi:transcriptional regulator with XRE-family HTH domain
MIFTAAIGRICRVTSGALIRQARTRAGLSQVELSQRSGKDRAQIALWERDVVQPSLETLRELLRACGWDVKLALVPTNPTPSTTAGYAFGSAAHRRSG